MNFGTLGAGFGGMGRVGAAGSLSASLLARYGGVGLSIVASDDSMAIVDTTTPANNYSGTPIAKLAITRASNATYWDSGGVLQTASSGVLRRDYDPRLLGASGYPIEEARTNVVLWNRDLTNAAWTKSNTTAAKDQTGIDGVANSASSLTATAGNGTCLQAITLGSSARYQSCFIKRITGSGTINMTMDNGSTWTAVTVTSAWTAVEIPTQTLANPTVGFRIVTNGDAVAIDYVQNENGAFRTSPIATTTASVTRQADVVSLATSLFPHSDAEGTFYAKCVFFATGSSGSAYPLAVSDGTANERHYVNYNSSGVLAAATIDGGATQVSLTGSVDRRGATPVRIAYAYKANDCQAVENGTSIGTDAASTMPTCTSLKLGAHAVGTTSFLNGWLLEVLDVPTRLPQATMQALTA